MVFVTRGSELNSKLVTQLLQCDTKPSKKSLPLLYDKTGSHLVQVVLQYSTSEVFTKVYGLISEM